MGGEKVLWSRRLRSLDLELDILICSCIGGFLKGNGVYYFGIKFSRVLGSEENKEGFENWSWG